MLKSRETRSRRACLYYSDSYPLVTSFCLLGEVLALMSIFSLLPLFLVNRMVENTLSLFFKIFFLFKNILK